MINILIVEDDIRVSDFLNRGLRAEGYRVQVASNGDDGLLMARELAQQTISNGEAGIILMDVMLPGMSGFDVCQSLRATGVSLPILMLTAMGTLEDRITGLRLGADDYLAKPFAFEELLARIEALTRRAKQLKPSLPTKLVVADLVLDLDTMRVTRDGITFVYLTTQTPDININNISQWIFIHAPDIGKNTFTTIKPTGC